MIDFRTFQKNSENSNSLDSFLSNNIQGIFDFLNNDYSVLKNSKADFREFVLTKFQIIEELPFAKSYNSAFVLLLFDYAERFKQISPARLLLNIIQQNNLLVGKRLEASQKFLFAKKYSEYLNESDFIFEKLEEALKEQEDDEKKTLLTLANYLSLVFENSGQFHKNIFLKLLEKLRLAQKDFSFLKFQFVNNLLLTDYNDFDKARESLQLLVDTFLKAKKEEIIFSDNFLTHEVNINYSQRLENVPNTFKAIWELNFRENQNFNFKDPEIYFSLRRGVEILTNPEQLIVYFVAYGKMHNDRLISAFNKLPSNFFKKKIQIIDWACGQGLATMSYFDFLRTKSLDQNLKNVILIDPSEIALKRGALHVQKFKSDVSIQLINKYLDKLDEQDFQVENSCVKLHFFSNILDIESFSMLKLNKLIRQNFQGENYFICVSPYITDLKTRRIDAFVEYFRQHFRDFVLIYEVNNLKREWVNDWTRVLRIFKVSL